MTTIGLSYSLVKISTKCAPALVDLRGHVQGDAGEEGGQLHVRRDDGRRVARGGGSGLIGRYFDGTFRGSTG